MTNDQKKHRVIGIRHTLKKIKTAGLISEDVMFPDAAVDQLNKTKKKADTATRHRVARSDAPIPSILEKIEKTFNLPVGSVRLEYPSGRKARNDTTVGQLRKKWSSE